MILVTGCTGLVGYSLVRRLIDEGRLVRGFARNRPNWLDPAVSPMQFYQGSILDLGALDAAMEGVEQVIHLVGILVETGRNTFANVHRQGTQNVVDVAKRHGVRRLIYMSSLGTRPNASSLYHRTKWEAEECLRHGGVPYTIFRPSVIFGPRDHFVNQFARIIRYLPFMPILGDGQSRMQPVWVEDVVHCVVTALADVTTIDQTFELGGPERLSFAEIMETIASAMGKSRVKFFLPMPLLRLEAAILERLLPRPPLTSDQLIMLREENICDINLMIKTFKIEPRNFREEIRTYL
ncbi:MAG: complex I NDUFA9 subunit family protein [Magnetococcales bacterium]|nr:complex I NDUFA9 subunit family protein [Magnetococcales bacterium]MBF0322565.1 complex I NDUFA9 subunit family protein [Magnetococcales bacterium]